MMLSQQTWTPLRTLTTQAAETGVPASALFVPIPGEGVNDGVPKEIEFEFDTLSLAGAPTSVTFNVWHYVGGKVDKFGTQITVLATDVAAPLANVLRLDAEFIWVTVASFAGGTAPTVSGGLRARSVS